jgi:hypothetical protein
MARTKVFAKADPLGEVVRSFAVNEEINQLLIERLDSRAWFAKTTSLPGLRSETWGTRLAFKVPKPQKRDFGISSLFESRL